jgi:hypothetical protein
MADPQPVSPRRSRGFSVKSDQSQNSGKSAKGHTRGPSESSAEKARRNLHTKADPLVAMNELQPSTLNARWEIASGRIPVRINLADLNSGGCASEVEFGLAARCPAQGSIREYHQFVSTGIPRSGDVFANPCLSRTRPVKPHPATFRAPVRHHSIV